MTSSIQLRRPPFILSLSKDPLSHEGRGARGEGPTHPPPFILSLSKDPLSHGGKGPGVRAVPTLPRSS